MRYNDSQVNSQFDENYKKKTKKIQRKKNC